MAAAFALLLLLPVFGQTNFNRTDGRISSGDLSVGVFADIRDAQLAKNYETNEGYGLVYLPLPNPEPTLANVLGSHLMVDTAYLANGLAAPQSTFFGDVLWASNDPDAYNTILITAENNGNVNESDEGCAVATVRTAGSRAPITVQMPLTAATGHANLGGMKSYYQAFVRILDPRAVDANGEPLYTSSPSPACADYNTNLGVTQADTASILARHGDRITIEVVGAGSVSVDVDGEGPDLLGITPEDLSHVRSNSLDYSFTVRDNDSGLRHDGELVITSDNDYTQVNPDNDHATGGEPLSVGSPVGQINVNGEAAEIDLKVWAKNAAYGTANDITDTGSWTLLGNAPGVAYSFSADTNDMDEGAYFLEVSGYDRAGNRTVSEAPDDKIPGPYLFTLDDTDPTTLEAWTGIAYEMNYLGGYEVADRSWIMVNFDEPVRPGINPERIRVAGHDVVSVYQPDYAPPVDRRVISPNGLSPSAQRLTFAPPAPRAAASFAPQAQTCTDNLAADVRIGGLSFTYDETTGDTAGDITISWDQLSDVDCHGYRMAILSNRTVLLVEDLPETASSYDIPRASELGRVIEADIEGSDQDTLTILVGLQYDSVGPLKDRFGRRTATTTVAPHNLTAPTGAVTGSVVAPFLLHPSSPPASLPAIPADDASIECGFTFSGGDEVVLSFTHTPVTVRGWTLVGYYRQLFYPPDYDVELGRLFDYTAVGADDYESSVSFQGYYTTEIQLYNAEGQVVGVYEKDGRRLAGAVRTVGCTGSTVGSTSPTVDNIPPRLVTARVDDSTLWLGYNEPLDGDSVPDPSAYTISGPERTVTDVDVRGSTVRLMLSTPVGEGEDVTLSYTPPQTTPVQDRAGNDAFRFRLWPVTNANRLSHTQSLMALGYWPEDINGVLIDDSRTRIYIELARELEADETPEVMLFGGRILDLAGNSNVTEAITPLDGIAPRFTVTVTATAQDRPIANARGEFIVDVRADEDLRRRPVVYFADIEAVERLEDGTGTGEYDYSIGDDYQMGSMLATQESAQHWRGTYPASGLTGLGELFGLVVYGFDYEDNIGESAGWEPPRHQRTPEIGPPKPNNDLDLSKMHDAGVLLEIDQEFNGDAAPEHTVAPSRRMRDNETESLNPFISIRFSMEEDEYAACPDDGCGGDYPDAEFSDSHARVDITAITLNDKNAISLLSRVDAGRFALVTNGLELGTHEIEYMAVDDAGNVNTFEFEFSVVEREPYELNVLPGWNLISFPGTPLDPSLGSVMPPGGHVSPVLAYQNGDWLTAVVNSEGEWAGNLTQFEAGFGYWLFATTYATLNPLIPEPEQTDTPPSALVKYGWNLLGVIDIFQNPAGTPPGADGSGNGEADDYFGSIPWRIAYTYNTVYARWVKSVPGADTDAPEDTDADEAGYREVVTKAAVTDADGNETAPAETKVVTQEILNGKGYWVWLAEPGTLVP